MTIRHWIFDFDGTLVDSAPAILEAFAVALDETDRTPQVALDNRLIGPPLTETLARISGSDDPAVIQTLTERFKAHYDRDGIAGTPAYPGTTALLEHLQGEGAILHIATNKRLSATLSILDHLGWLPLFSSVYALDMVDPRIPSKAQLLKRQLAERGLSAHETAYIGDKREDGQAATANSLRFHYASWGYGDLAPTELPRDWHWLQRPLDLLADRTSP